MFTFWLFLLTVGASARITRIIVSDTITRTIRAKLWAWTGGKLRLMRMEENYENPDEDGTLVFDEWRWSILNCPWCIGFWISLAVTALAYVSHGATWFVVPAIGLTVSYVIAFIAGYEKSE